MSDTLKHPTLVVTGITGFLGGHVALEALRRGHHVRGTLRNLDRADHVRTVLQTALGEDAKGALSRLSFHEADLLSSDGWADIVRGADAVMHVASPFPLGVPKQESDLVEPARQGVRHVVEACIESGVPRLVQTSSSVAIMYGHGRDRMSFDERDWTDLGGDMISAYIKSKTLAELDLWMMAKAHPELVVSTVNPGFILGPVLDPMDAGTSCDVILKMMRGDYPGVPKLGYPTVDVRDVVDLQFHVLDDADAGGERYAATESTLPFRAMAQAVKSAHPAAARKVGTKELPNWFLKVFALFEPTTRVVLPELGYMPEVSHDKATRRYGWTPRPAAEAAVATADSLIALGHLR